MRSFWKAPVFTIGAILTLTLAIGANTAIFSILNALVLRDLPVREPSSLISLARVTPCDGRWGVFAPDVPRARRTAAEPVGAHWLDLEQRHQCRNRRCPNPRQCFCGHGELLYRARDSARHRAGADGRRRQRRHTASAPIAVIGHAFWQRHFNRDPAAVGRTVRVEGTPFTIVGVAPAGFKGIGLTLEIDVAVPLTFVPIVRDVPSRAFLNGTVNPISLTGRLHPGVTIDQARAELTTLWPAVLTAVIPADFAGAQRRAFSRDDDSGPGGCKGRRARPAQTIHAATRDRDGDCAVRRADRVRQYRQPHDVAGVVTDARNGRPARAWGGPLAADAPRACRRCDAVARRRPVRRARGDVGQRVAGRGNPGHVHRAAVV